MQQAGEIALTADQALFLFVSTILTIMIFGALFAGVYFGWNYIMRKRKRKAIINKIAKFDKAEIITWDKFGTPVLIKYISKAGDAIYEYL